MRYLLVAADKSSQLPVEIPDEIVVHRKSSKAKSAAPKIPSKLKRLSKAKKNTVFKKHKQISRAIAK